MKQVVWAMRLKLVLVIVLPNLTDLQCFMMQTTVSSMLACMYNVYMYMYHAVLIGAHHLHYSAKWIRVNGIMYKPPCAVILSIDEDTPIFGKVQKVLVCGNKLFLHTRVRASAPPFPFQG